MQRDWFHQDPSIYVTDGLPGAPSLPKPTFIFVPSGWHTPEYFNRCISLLATYGYPSYTLSLPSVGCSPGLSDFGPDVAALQSLIYSRLAVGESLIVVLHSYGGHVGSEAVLPEMLIEEREKVGLLGGIQRLVYVTASAIPVGESVESFDKNLGRETTSSLASARLDGTTVISPVYAPALFYNDITDPTALRALIEHLKPHSQGAVQSRLTRAAHTYTPATYVICEKDVVMSRERVEMIIRLARETWEEAFSVVESVNAGHMPFVSCPEEMVRILRRAAGDGVQRRWF